LAAARHLCPSGLPHTLPLPHTLTSATACPLPTLFTVPHACHFTTHHHSASPHTYTPPCTCILPHYTHHTHFTHAYLPHTATHLALYTCHHIPYHPTPAPCLWTTHHTPAWHTHTGPCRHHTCSNMTCLWLYLAMCALLCNLLCHSYSFSVCTTCVCEYLITLCTITPYWLAAYTYPPLPTQHHLTITPPATHYYPTHLGPPQDIHTCFLTATAVGSF